MTAGSGSLPAKRKPHADSAQMLTKKTYRQLATRHYTTMFTSLPGTMMTLRTAEVPTNFWTLASARAAARTVASSASTATVICARNLPFTCTTICTVADCNACASTSRQGSSISAVLCPNPRQSAWVTCGMIGDSAITAISNASCETLRSCGAACGNLATAFNSSMTAAIAVLKVRRRPMSSVTFARVWCECRRSARCGSVSAALSSGAAEPDDTWSYTAFHNRLMNRNAPCTPSSDHSKVCSGGAANMMNSRAVSAPNSSTSTCGSTPLFLDLDIVTTPPDSTCRPSAFSTAILPLPLLSGVTDTSAGLKYCSRPESLLRKKTSFSTMP